MEIRLERILLVDDEEENLKALERALRAQYEVVSVKSPDAAMQELQKKTFSVVISDQKMPGTSGTEFLAKVAQSYPLTSRMILTAHPATGALVEAINRAEIFRFIGKPWENQDLLMAVQQAAERNRLLTENQNLVKELTALNKNLESLVEKRTLELKVANEKLSELAMTDPLTKLLNRRAFSKKLLDEVERSSRYKHPMVIAMVDVDHFKHFNDSEGHVLADEALKKMGQILLGNLRKSDSLARYGGEEFIIMMPETKLSSGSNICERLRLAIENQSFQGQSKAAYLTVSIGLCEFPESGEGPEELISAADKALYEAKQAGRNRVVTNRHAKHTSFFVT